MSESLREEIMHWRFLDSWTGCVSWREEKHVRLALPTDASGYRDAGKTVFGDYWTAEQKVLTIPTKEMLAIVQALAASPANVRDCRVDVQVHSQVVIDTCKGQGQGSKHSLQLTEVTKALYSVVSQRNVQLELSHVASGQNEADGVDATLSPKSWAVVESRFGGPIGHTFDLMALDSNAQCSQQGSQLPHFTPWPSPQSRGINVFAQDLSTVDPCMSNPYVYPPFWLIGRILRFMMSFRIPFTMVVPELYPRPYWWPLLFNLASENVCLGQRGDLDVVRFPTKSDYVSRPSPFTFWAVRVSRF
jgi:hypothetical protein